ncbi:Hypothetical protein AA314_05667 [Archangium gephyra]|uniref:Uncharacterized protein n=1 Tax=Archangium gephyra TaxID=48 RepID=A0AAC8QBK0_9BACT|nr:Hypothetical protein AA314_05667 [Archangium gephyra]
MPRQESRKVEAWRFHETSLSLPSLFLITPWKRHSRIEQHSRAVRVSQYDERDERIQKPPTGQTQEV